MKRLFPVIILLCFSACRQKDKVVNKAALQDYKKAYAFLGRQDDSAFFYFNRLVNSVNDSLQSATAYNYMAAIQSGAGDYFGAQESLSLSLKYLDTLKPSHRACLTSDYNELGLTKLELKDPDAALPYFEKAIRLTADTGYRNTYLNNLALAYQNGGHFERAVALYHQLILKNSRAEDYARILTNTAISRWGMDKSYDAAPMLMKSLSTRIQIKDDWGINSSYANLSNYYSAIRPDSALHYARLQYAVATRLKSPDDRLHALQIMTAFSPGAVSKTYFAQYRSLDDSLQKARNAAKNQFALIRFNVQRKEADNLRLQKENADAQAHLVQQRLMILVMILLLATALVWYRKRRQHFLLEARKKELRLSQRVHDVVANGLYKVMNDLENNPAIDQETLLDEIETLYEQSRDISYGRELGSQSGFAARVSKLADRFSGETIRMAVSGNNTSIWQDVGPAVQEELLLVLQELLVNIAKHSRAKLAAINFQRNGEHITLEVLDDGIGLPEGTLHGNGLRGTVSRIETIKGRVIFEPNLPSGLLVKITFPVA